MGKNRGIFSTDWGDLKLSVWIMYVYKCRCAQNHSMCVKARKPLLRVRSLLLLWVLRIKLRLSDLLHRKHFNLLRHLVGPTILSIIYLFVFYLFLCVWVFCLHVCWHTMCVLCPQNPEEGTWVTCSCKPPCGFLEWNLGSGKTANTLNYCFLQFLLSL